MGLKRRVLGGLVWSGSGRIGAQVAGIVVMVLLMRVLSPADFGLLGMAMVWVAFFRLFEEAGFGLALVQREELEPEDVATAFSLNLAVGALLAGATVLLAPVAATFFGEPRLRPLLEVMSIGFPLSAIASLPEALLARAFRFRRLAFVEILSVGGGGALALGLALAGRGAASLAWQIVGTAGIRAALAIALAGWVPRPGFSRARAARLIDFAWGLTGFNVLNWFSRQLDKLLVGRVLGKVALGYYGRAYSLMLLPLNQVVSVFSRVMFPALSSLKGDLTATRVAYLRVNRAISLVVHPMMVGLSVLAEPFVRLVLGEPWAPMTTTLRILTLVALVQSVASPTGWLYLSRGRTRRLLLWGVASSTVTVVCVAVGVALGSIESTAAMYGVSALLLLYPCLAFAGRMVDLEAFSVLRAVLPQAAAAAAMGAVVRGADLALSGLGAGNAVRLAVGTAIGVGSYLLVLVLTRNAGLGEVRLLLRERRERLEAGAGRGRAPESGERRSRRGSGSE